MSVDRSAAKEFALAQSYAFSYHPENRCQLGDLSVRREPTEYGACLKTVVVFVGVLTLRALLFGVPTRAPGFWKLPTGRGAQTAGLAPPYLCRFFLWLTVDPVALRAAATARAQGRHGGDVLSEVMQET